MRNRRKNCVVCGKGFMCMPNDPILFDKKKCAIRYYGKDWHPGLYHKPIKAEHWSKEDKIAWIREQAKKHETRNS